MERAKLSTSVFLLYEYNIDRFIRTIISVIAAQRRCTPMIGILRECHEYIMYLPGSPMRMRDTPAIGVLTLQNNIL